jgi:hypothetical protein
MNLEHKHDGSTAIPSRMVKQCGFDFVPAVAIAVFVAEVRRLTRQATSHHIEAVSTV